MADIDDKLCAMGLELHGPIELPLGVKISFPWVRVWSNRAFVSGHAPLARDGSFALPLGRVGVEVTPDEAHQAARLTALAVLASLKDALGRT